MVRSTNFTALLDACVLYPAPIRDLWLSLADENFFRPKWSDQIQHEWVRNLILNRKDLTPEKLQRTVNLMDETFPDAKVTGHEHLIPAMTLPDPKDNHVVAAALKSRADVIVTTNPKDFPKKYLEETFNIEPIHPDQFIVQLIDLDPGAALQALLKQQSRLMNPPQTIFEVLETLEKASIPATAEMFRGLIGQEKQKPFFTDYAKQPAKKITRLITSTSPFSLYILSFYPSTTLQSPWMQRQCLS